MQIINARKPCACVVFAGVLIRLCEMSRGFSAAEQTILPSAFTLPGILMCRWCFFVCDSFAVDAFIYSVDAVFGVVHLR